MGQGYICLRELTGPRHCREGLPVLVPLFLLQLQMGGPRVYPLLLLLLSETSCPTALAQHPVSSTSWENAPSPTGDFLAGPSPPQVRTLVLATCPSPSGERHSQLQQALSLRVCDSKSGIVSHFPPKQKLSFLTRVIRNV